MPWMNKKPVHGTALDLALAIRRYHRMKDPAAAFTALNQEWPEEIAAIVTKVMWPAVKMRTVSQIARDTAALMKRAAAAHKAVEKAKRRPQVKKAA
jgi:hypothetical protein